MTPSGYNGSYKVLTVPTANTFTVAIAVDPTSYSAGGTVTKLSMFTFDTVEGLAATDVVKFYEETTGTYENATIQYVDTATGTLGFNSITSALFTVANKAKVELIPQTPSYQAPKVLSFVDTRFYLSDTVANAYLASPENVENREIEYMNGLEERY